ncbi:MAG: glycoside hydrolase family 64 protein [Burkholderiaceae bacterium]
MTRLPICLACPLAGLLVALAPAARAQTAADYAQGVTVAGGTATIWFQPSSSSTTWTDVHYQLDGGPQQNLRMARDASTGRETEAVTTPVSAGSTLRYFFTYNKGSPAYDSASYDYTVGSGSGSGSGGGSGGTWNHQTTFHLVNGTHGAYGDAQVYWAIVGKDWATGRFVHVDAGGALVPMSTADNGALAKGGVAYTDYFHTLAQASTVTIPPINSARLLLSVGGPMYIRVNQDAAGNLGYTGANIENPSDPNIDVTFDFVEMAIDPNSGFYGNTTRVDQFGFPVTLRLQGLGGYDQTVGETQTRAALVSEFAGAVPGPFQGLAQSPYLPYRIVAPGHASFRPGQPNANYLDGYIATVWNEYQTRTLTFTDQQGTFTGHVVNGAFVFTDGQGTYTIARAPTTAEALLGNGVLNDPTGQSPGTPGWDKQLQIQAQLCAAINRHIVENPSQWSTPGAFYGAGSAANWYARFWHDHAIGGLAYGFPYDDVGGFSSSLHTAAPTTATVTIGW